MLEKGKRPVKIGTTGKGIGPSYEDKIARKGIKLSDLFDKKGFISKDREISSREVILI